MCIRDRNGTPPARESAGTTAPSSRRGVPMRRCTLVDMLNVVQTTIGILLTGIFGFILGNKIRNQ